MAHSPADIVVHLSGHFHWLYCVHCQ